MSPTVTSPANLPPASSQPDAVTDSSHEPKRAVMVTGLSAVGSSVLEMTMAGATFAWPTSSLMVNDECGMYRSRTSIPSATGWTPDQFRSVVVIADATSISSFPCRPPNVVTNDYVGLSDLMGLLDYSTYLPAGTLTYDPARQTFGIEPRRALSDLADWTSLPTSRIGDLLGVARRSLYNWMNGKSVRPEIQTRLSRVHDVLQPIAAQREPEAVRQWLDEGRPTNFELLSEQQWPTLDRRAQALLNQQKVRRIADTAELSTNDVDAYSQSVRTAVFAQFSARSSSEQARRDDWVPRELTGALGYEDDDED